jgi:hypothetical protein
VVATRGREAGSSVKNKPSTKELQALNRIPPHIMATKPDSDGAPSLPRRVPRGLLPSTWIDRSLKVEYSDGFGSAQEASGVLLEMYPAGPILLVDGARKLISWDRLVWLELIEDAG